jgi:hypothetical protein
MADDLKSLAPERVGEVENILGQPVKTISVDADRSAAQIVAALVWDYDPEPDVRKRPDIAAPSVPEFGKTVQQKEKRAIGGTRLNDVKSNAADGDSRMFDLLAG